MVLCYKYMIVLTHVNFQGITEYYMGTQSLQLFILRYGACVIGVIIRIIMLIGTRHPKGNSK